MIVIAKVVTNWPRPKSSPTVMPGAPTSWPMNSGAKIESRT